MDEWCGAFESCTVIETTDEEEPEVDHYWTAVCSFVFSCFSFQLLLSIFSISLFVTMLKILVIILKFWRILLLQLGRLLMLLMRGFFFFFFFFFFC